MGFPDLAAGHRHGLDALAQEPEWRELIAGGAVDAARQNLLTPRRPANVFKLPVEQLRRFNESRVRAMIARGERDPERLLDALSTWPDPWPAEVPVALSFVGLNLGFACDMDPRCIYCNQRPVVESMTRERWLALVRSVIPAEGEGPYLFITGGEPLLRGDVLWGEDGLVRTATARGAACNINSNALGLNATVALEMVSAGLSRLHVSLDTHRAEVQDAICGREGCWERVVRGIRNVQLARILLGAAHPVIHVNCVLTRLNASDFPDFLRFLLGMKLLGDGADPRDLDLHLIPVGGENNRNLRLTAEEYVRFFTETWDRADALWREFQADWSVPEDQRGALHEKVPYMSPYHRVRHGGDLRQWAEVAARGLPAALSGTGRCHVAPTQAFILPDGSQYWCGGHATSRPTPVGNVLEASVQENIAQSIGQVRQFPGPQCASCPGATQAINQSVDAALRGLVGEWLAPTEPPVTTDTADASAFE